MDPITLLSTQPGACQYASGPGRLIWDQVDAAHTPQAARARLEWPAWRISWTMIDHDIHHGAEIGALRDLCRVTRVASHSGAAM
ncbi:MAG TPA: hypothetical protein VFH63_05370 [candidate division Zixibacteria bacterium]|nr:hypothetical protein [candidate division Zixibacteria bacterium]